MNQWRAPTANEPVNALVRVPGSKSLTNRALLLAALASGQSTIRHPLRARDTLLMANALRSLGAAIVDDGPDWRVIAGPIIGGATIDCGLAGTVMRFVPPVATLAETGATGFDGDPRARDRPMRSLLDALRALGARIDDDGRGSLPFIVHGGGVTGGRVSIDASASSQLVSGLLLTAPRWNKGIEIHHVGPSLPSIPHIEMTVAELRSSGAEVDTTEPNVWRVAPAKLAPRETVVEPDLSNAAPFAAAALVTGGRVTIAEWPARTAQPGDALRGLLNTMGATTEISAGGLTFVGHGIVHGIDADLADTSELLPVVTALAALAGTPSRLRGVAHVRGHETDRLVALATELNNLGGNVTETDDGLMIRPRQLHGGRFRTYNDHRLAMAAAVIGLVTPGIEIEDMATTGKTMPDFADRWLAMLSPGGFS